jgi:hypothetical protein
MSCIDEARPVDWGTPQGPVSGPVQGDDPVEDWGDAGDTKPVRGEPCGPARPVK